MKNLFLGLAFFSLFACNESESPNQNPEFGEVIDIQGNKYSTIKIGEQTWMAENLNVSVFRNGDPIPEAKTSEEWRNAYRNFKPVWSHYQNLEGNGKKYGKLYNWYAVSDPRGLTPIGWEVPFVEEWQKLSNYLGGDEVAGKKLKSKEGWEIGGNGSDEVNFKALPGNYRYYLGDFEPRDNNGQFASWWTSMPSFSGHSWNIQLHSSLDQFTISSVPQGMGYSIRAIKR